MRNRVNYIQIKIFLINFFWNVIKIMIIFCELLKNIFINIFSFYNTNINEFNIYFINKSNIVLKCNYNGINNLSVTLPEYNYILYKKLFDNKILTVILDNIDRVEEFNNIEDNIFVPCDFTFIYVVIKTDDNIYDITNIMKDNNNYYYINNSIIFNKSFIDWICINHLNLNNYLKNYNVVLIDNNANEKTINDLQYIKLNKNNYDII